MAIVSSFSRLYVLKLLTPMACKQISTLSNSSTEDYTPVHQPEIKIMHFQSGQASFECFLS